jgi:hypothetical protein
MTTIVMNKSHTLIQKWRLKKNSYTYLSRLLKFIPSYISYQINVHRAFILHTIYNLRQISLDLAHRGTTGNDQNIDIDVCRWAQMSGFFLPGYNTISTWSSVVSFPSIIQSNCLLQLCNKFCNIHLMLSTNEPTCLNVESRIWRSSSSIKCKIFDWFKGLVSVVSFCYHSNV